MLFLKVVVAEKPDIAKAISAVLPGQREWKDGYIEQGEYCIAWCYGHLLTLKEPEDYGPEYSRENTPISKLPIFFENWGLKIAESGTALLKSGKAPPDKGKQVRTIGSLLNKASLVIIAGDCDDEGQLLVEELLEWHKYKGPLKRVDTTALNAESMKKAMANLQDNGAWHMRAVSARARSVADFAHGINCSRFFSATYKANLSVGRVQTAALGLVVNRDAQIEGHLKKKYYLLDIEALLLDGKPAGPHPVRFIPAEDSPHLIDGRIENKAVLEKLGQALIDREFPADVSKNRVQESAPLPFSISALKTYCANKFGLSPDDTLKITQSLRMNYGGLITYNRSECRYLPTNQHAEAPKVIGAIQANLGLNPVGLNPSFKSRVWNDKNTSVHHAIIPTTQRADISKLTADEKNVYRAVCEYYLVQFLPLCEKEQTRLVISGKGGNKFTAISTKILSPGYRSFLNEGYEDESSILSDVPAGKYNSKLQNPKITEKETQPPSRYTDTSLEEDMKSVAKYVTDPEAKRLLLLKDKDEKEENGSIGTAATRTAIIATLKKRGFLVNEGKKLISTKLGRDFYNILPDEIRKPDLTAKWWAIQQAIQEGTATPEALYKDVLSEYRKLAAKSYPAMNLSGFGQAKEQIGVCPRCGRPVVEWEKSFGCTGYKEGCKFAIWKTGAYGAHKVLAYSKKKVTETMAKHLLSAGKHLVKGLKSEKTGKEYDAYIVMVDNGSSVFLNLDFNDVPKRKK